MSTHRQATHLVRHGRILDRVRPLAARHPVATATSFMLVVGWSTMIPATLAGFPVEPFLLLTVLVGQLGGSVLVTGAQGGRSAVVALFASTVRWRVRPELWLTASLGTVVPALLLTSLLPGAAGFKALLADARPLLAWLVALSILPMVNLWEEMSWTGVIQSRLTERHGLVRGAVVTAPFFALIHLPLLLGQPVHTFVLSLVTLILAAVPFRVVTGWLYEQSDQSVLLVATFHAAFNATNNGPLLSAAAPDQPRLTGAAAWIVISLWALAIVTFQAARRRRTRTTEPGPRAELVA